MYICKFKQLTPYLLNLLFMKKLILLFGSLLLPLFSFASEADLEMPVGFATDSKTQILYWGFAVVVLGLLFGFWQFSKVRKLKAHKSMLEIGEVIFKTCSTYLKQQGKFLIILFLFIECHEGIIHIDGNRSIVVWYRQNTGVIARI